MDSWSTRPILHNSAILGEHQINVERPAPDAEILHSEAISIEQPEGMASHANLAISFLSWRR